MSNLDFFDHQQQINDFCEKFDISYLGLFGSHARKEATVGSDVDVLVEFKKPVSFFRLIDAENYLSEKLGSDVDLVTTKSLKPQIKPYIQQDLKHLYERPQ